jgi:hypothetical protein
MSLTVLVLYLSVGTGACQSKLEPDLDGPKSTVPFKSAFKIQDLTLSPSFVETPISRGKVDLDEVSGMAYSFSNPGFLWVHQDSGDGATLYLLDASNGETAASYMLEGYSNRDWEDMEIGPGPDTGKSYLYIGETGDNEQMYGDYSVIRLEEPRFVETHRGKALSISTGVEKLSFKYPTKNHDVECLLVDPFSKNIYLVTKRDFFAKVYEIPFPQKVSGQNTLREVGTFPFTIVTAGSVSKDGLQVAIKTYDRIFNWVRQPNQSFVDMLATTPNLLPYQREPQGEAICFHPNGGYFTISEKADGDTPDLFFYSKK